MNIKATLARLKRIEKAAKIGSYDAFLKNLPDDQLSTYVTALGAVLDVEDEEEGTSIAAGTIAEQLGWSEDRARGFYLSCLHAGDRRFERMTDEQLIVCIKESGAKVLL